MKWPVPQTITEVGSFLEFAKYYCQILKGNMKVVSPMYGLISGDNANQKNKTI